MKITTQSIIPCQNNENHAITRIPYQNYGNHEKNVFQCNENHEIPKFRSIKKKIITILLFHIRITNIVKFLESNAIIKKIMKIKIVYARI